MPTTAREIHLASRPNGWPTPDNFRTVASPDPEPGQVLVRNTFMSVDPYMRGRMNDVKSYVPPFALDAPLDGGAVGEVVASGSDDLAVGDTVLPPGRLAHPRCCRRRRCDASMSARSRRRRTSAHSACPASRRTSASPASPRSARATPCSSRVRPGRPAPPSGRIARQLGAAKVTGSAGTAEKCAWLTDDLGFGVALNYKDAPIGRQLREHLPVDVYFDNVGGDHLEAAIFAMATRADRGLRRHRGLQRRRTRPRPAQHDDADRQQALLRPCAGSS